jgi:hypothetical protein
MGEQDDDQWYRSFARRLHQELPTVTPSEVHGILCGLYCGGLPQDSDSWKKPLLEQISEQPAVSSDLMVFLTALQKRLLEQLSTLLGFTPLLPPDDEALDKRLAALVNWCEGWLLGFGMVAQGKLDEDTREAVKDIQQIADVEQDVGDADDSWERAFWEVVEHLRVAVEVVITAQQKPLDEAHQSRSVH